MPERGLLSIAGCDSIRVLIIRTGFGVYYTISIIRSPQNPILIIKAPALVMVSWFRYKSSQDRLYPLAISLKLQTEPPSKSTESVLLILLTMSKDRPRRAERVEFGIPWPRFQEDLRSVLQGNLVVRPPPPPRSACFPKQPRRLAVRELSNLLSLSLRVRVFGLGEKA